MQLRVEYPQITNQTFSQIFVNNLNVLAMNVICPLSIETECSKCPPAAATQT